MKKSQLLPFLSAAVVAIAVAAVVFTTPTPNAEADSGPFRCSASSLYFPTSGIIGWTYRDPSSTDVSADGSATIHTGVDVFADGGPGSPVYAPADGKVTRPVNAQSIDLDLPGVTNLITGKPGIQVYYAHITPLLSVGQTFTAGQVIGYQASDHVHFSVGAFMGYDDRVINETQDPSAYYGATLNQPSTMDGRQEAATWCTSGSAEQTAALPAAELKQAAATATPAPTATEAPAPANQTYVVQAGDTLSGIAAKFDVSVDDVAAANSLTSLDYLSIGQELTIPGVAGTTATTAGFAPADSAGTASPAAYTVVAGDTLSTIAAEFGTDMEAILAGNNITDLDYLSIGQVLVIPGAGEANGVTGGASTTTATASPGSYTIVAGDTLSSIAAQFGTDTDAIIAANNIADPDFLTVGDVLQIP